MSVRGLREGEYVKDLSYLEQFRVDIYGLHGDEHNGAFRVYVGGRSFNVIASNGGGWEHVSVTRNNGKRCPTWDEMCAIKAMFFEQDEVVMQLHPAEKDYVNIHPYCLHLWRPVGQDIPLPPVEFV